MSLTLVENVEKEVLPRIKSQDDALAKLANQPFAATTSGARKNLYEIQYEHAMTPDHPEVAIIGTGNEFLFGENSSSYVTADEDMIILRKIDKFSFKKDYHYYLLVYKEQSNTIDIIERIGYHHNTESYGFMNNNNNLDSLAPGDKVGQGTVLKTSTSMDEYGNRMDGVNVNVLYASLYGTTEDGIWVREGAREKFSVPLVRKTVITANKNDIPLNIFGDDNIYKILPDIQESLNGGILYSQRREEKDQSLYMQSWRMLRKILMSDEKFVINGENIEVVDINVYCNDLDIIKNNAYYSQLTMYSEERQRCARELVCAVNEILSEYNLNLENNVSYILQNIYDDSIKIMNNKKHIKDKVYNNLIIEVYTIEHNKLNTGDKISDRFGGKGVVTRIVPDELMPRNKDGELVDVIVDSYTMGNRKNPGQNLEQECNFTSGKLLSHLRSSNLSTDEIIDTIIRYREILCPALARDFEQTINGMKEDDRVMFLNSIFEDRYIYQSFLPITESITIDTLKEVYNTFPWIELEEMQVPIEGSDGEIRFVPARRKAVFAPKYMYRLKQYAEEKFSVTSLSATNVKNENTKSKASKNHTALYNNTPVRFGEMESADFAHVGMEYVLSMMMVHSVSPKARRLVEKLLVDNPYEINIKPDGECTNRSAEILNTYLKTAGLRLTFTKIRKIVKDAIIRNAVDIYYNPLNNAITTFKADQHIDVKKFYEFKDKQAKDAITKEAITMYLNQETDTYEIDNRKK